MVGPLLSREEYLQMVGLVVKMEKRCNLGVKARTLQANKPRLWSDHSRKWSGVRTLRSLAHNALTQMQSVPHASESRIEMALDFSETTADALVGLSAPCAACAMCRCCSIISRASAGLRARIAR